MGFYAFAVTFPYFLRMTVIAVVVVLAIVCGLDWLVRTRRIHPFHPIARAMRRVVDPLIAPIERRIVRAGGLPSAAPLWALAGAVVLGILLVTGADFVVQSLMEAMYAVSAGPSGLYVLLVRATFGFLRLAIIVVVIVSWLPISPYSPWVRWAFAVSEPLLRPLRQIVPRFGMLDITPIVAYFLLVLLEGLFLRF